MSEHLDLVRHYEELSMKDATVMTWEGLTLPSRVFRVVESCDLTFDSPAHKLVFLHYVHQYIEIVGYESAIEDERLHGTLTESWAAISFTLGTRFWVNVA